jgi:hypothetical protein
MKKLDTSAVNSTNGLPVKSGTLDHIQNAYAEAVAEAVKGMVGSIYSSVLMYVLNGCKNTGSGSNYIISAGSVFIGGEVYLVDAATFTITGSNVAVGSIVTTFFSASNADSVTFTDGVARNIHQIRKIVFAPGLSGSGAADYEDVQAINTNIPKLNLNGTGRANVTGTYPNITVNVPLNGVLASGLTNIGDISPSGGTTVTVAFASVGTASYIVAGSVESFGNPTDDSLVVHSITNKTASSFDLHFQELIANTQNIKFGWALIAL